MRLSPLLTLALALVPLTAVPVRAGGSGLLPNPDFDDLDNLDIVEGWYEIFPDISEMNNLPEMDDADGCPGSGAADGINTNPKDSGTATWSACTNDVQPGESYRVSGWIRFPVGTSASRAGITFIYLPQADCFGARLGEVGGPPSHVESTQTSWVRLESPPLTAPEGTLSARVDIYSTKFDAIDPVADVYFDKIYFDQADFIFSEDFESGSACRWSVEAGLE